MMIRRTILLLVMALALIAAQACGDDENPGGAPANNDLPDVSEPEPQPEPQPEPEPQPDASPDPEDVVEPEPEPEPVEDVGVPDVPDEPDAFEGLACVADEECPEDHLCLGAICTVNPVGRAYVEFNYVLEEPAALSNAFSVLKGFFGDVGFFLIEFGPLDDEGVSEMVYGGADRLIDVNDGPDTWRWQLPDELPSTAVHPLREEGDPLNGRRWQSDTFDYQLVALFGDTPNRLRLGFEAAQTVLTMEFSEDLSQIVSGRLDGYITRDEAVTRTVDLSGNCLLAVGLCPAHSCANDPPLETLADILDCLEVPLNADIDPNIEGHDAYTAAIFFQSEAVIIAE